MKLKKINHKNLKLKRKFYFIIGLLIALILTYIFLEWKTEDDTNGYDISSLSNKKQDAEENHTLFIN